MITVATEPDRKLVRAQMRDMLSIADVVAFGEEEQAAVRAMGLGSREFFLLIETHGNQVQTQEVMEAFRDLLLHSPLKAKRIATVRSGVLTRMQARRIQRERSDSEVFDNLAEAEAWLFA